MSGPGVTDQRILTSSAVMAAGTIVSRASGYVRAALLVAALGAVLRADLFTIANTLPNMVYILLAGGIFNAVLVPQLVRRIKDDPDGGDAYASRVITLSALFLGVVTVVLVVLAPQLLSVYLDDRFLEPDRAAQLDSIVDLTRWCLPQVFFYGMYVLIGQVLNARGRFGPMMWAPIANNLLAMAVLVLYLVIWGPVGGGPDRYAALDTGQEVLLGLGSTLGIVAQCLVLVPYLRASGFIYRPRFDFRDPELKKTSAGPNSARVGAKVAAVSGSDQPNAAAATSSARIGRRTAKGSTRARAVRSVEPTVLPSSGSRSSCARVESRGRIAVASDTVTMAWGTIMMSRLLE